MSSTYLIYSPKEKEVVRVGSLIGWAVSSYHQSSSLGELVLAILAENGKNGIILLTHEEFEFDQKLSLCVNKTEHFNSETKIKSILIHGLPTEFNEFFIASESGESLSVKANRGNILSILDDNITLKSIAEFAMRNKGKRLMC